MRVSFSLLFVCICFSAWSQNVGINKSNPTQPLDVNGNVNIDGKLMTSSVAGKSGQVLMTNAAGGTAWGNVPDFKNVIQYASSGTFVIPDTVTKVMIEAWGGGGGGAAGGGGGGGGYATTVIAVTPNTNINITAIGTGGTGATGVATATDGGATSVSYSGNTVAYGIGGSGATAVRPGYGAGIFTTAGLSYAQKPGQNGSGNQVSFQQKNATTFVVVRKYGDGGAVYPAYAVKSEGQTVVSNESNSAVIESYPPMDTSRPGGGGGGGTSQSKGGAPGMVLIWF